MLGLDLQLRGAVPAVTRGHAGGWSRFVVLAALLAACHPAYQAPSLAEPQATLKLRIVYHDTPGTTLDQLVLVNGQVPGVPEPVRLPGEVSRAIPVRLQPTRIDLQSVFFHMTTIMESRVQSFPCGPLGKTCTRFVMVPVTRRVMDAACERAVGLGPQKDGVYLLQYDYYAHDHCTLACWRQWPQPDGTFRNAPCEPAS